VTSTKQQLNVQQTMGMWKDSLEKKRANNKAKIEKVIKTES